ncbi:hypothetical protein C4K03_1019 [Pseudomonas synxantha]|uniref:Uncharacterized protein n=1 Tax=Pseudomonas synxantha TaxID=47883 RepID=A0A3G7U1P7_9PSED|nr:hypothetical protein [Pseudomonas synxantha]AZE53190.1 hypothetical protein C4K03_1019 [Pseudomonas synxantha]
MALPALFINAVALLVACSGALVLFITRLHAQRAMADLAMRSEERAIDQPMLFLDTRTERAHRQAYRVGFACLGLALAASWLSTHF